MKLKLTILLALFAAGVFASLALADGGGHGKHAENACREVHISGTVAPQTLAVTVAKSSQSLIPAGTMLNLPVGAAGQTVRLRAEACATGTGTSLVLTVKRVELRAIRAEQATTTGQTTTTRPTTTEKRDEHHGRHDRTTTTTTTTAPATTTTAGTTTTTKR
jgi:hypothetical protein